MKKTSRIITFLFTITLTLVVGLTQSVMALPAFPGAEGYGANTIGGRYGQIFIVDNLNDSGPGSLRAAVEATGPRTVVFKVSGNIVLMSSLVILNPFLTIAGQTSPSGICIAGYPLTINTHEVIITHMRFRVGTQSVNYQRDSEGNIVYFDELNSHSNEPGTCVGNIVSPPTHPKDKAYPCPLTGGEKPGNLDNFVIYGEEWGRNPAYNIIIDHCSFSWGVDETLTITGGVENTTISWSIISEGLSHAGHSKGEHSKGLMVASYAGNSNSVSIHHNYIAHNTARNPLIAANLESETSADVVNNVVYNWYGGMYMHAYGIPEVNFTHNYVKQGPMSRDYSREVMYRIKEIQTPVPILYVHGNIGSTRLSQEEPQWNVGEYFHDRSLDPAWQQTTRWNTPTVTTSEMSRGVANCILNSVGAMGPKRDVIDSRVIRDFHNGTGTIRSNVVYPDDYAVYPDIQAPEDNDRDGMADSWEESQGLNSSQNDSAEDKDNDGYTNIEEYFHFLSAESVPGFDTCLSDAVLPAPANLRLQ